MMKRDNKFNYMGVDPGQSGAIVVIDNRGCHLGVIRLSEPSKDIANFVASYADQIQLCSLEKVNAMPGQGVSSTFKFGTSFGFCMGVLTSCFVRYEMVTPSQWQTRMKCRTKGDKNVTKELAGRLFPHVDKITHKEADAMLLAEYARRRSLGIE
tara:strand:+ start:432 stop:893 length:462 start_codon:yes stop_codon:yes gene_type:complete